MTEKKPSRQPLLQSKLNPPIGGRFLVPRPRLIECIQSAQHAKLVILRAPAGFGKTTLMAQCQTQMQEQGNPTAWITLDEADNDPVRFLTYLIAAIQKIIPEFDLSGREPDLMFAGHAPTGVFLYVLNRMSSFAPPLTLFLDNFGVIRSQEVLEIIKQLYHHLPTGKRLVIALRKNPALGLGRIRAQGDLVEINLKDLRFTYDETEKFIQQTQGLKMNERDIDYLYRFTEGWVAGLQLSTLSSIRRENQEKFGYSPSGVLGNITDYLVEEVLARQPEEVQSFLLQTSILNTLSGPLCDALTGRTDGFQMLEYVEKENLFLIPLDEEHRWYRYHSIFAKFLKNRLQQRTPNQHMELHKAACSWYMGVGDLNEAAEHALSAGDAEYAAEQMARCAMDLVKTGQAATVAIWGERLPKDVLSRHPELQLAYAYAMTIRYKYDMAIEVLDQLQQNLKQANIESHFIHDLLSVRAIALLVQDRIKECEQVTMEVFSEPILNLERHTRFLPTLFNVAGFLKMTSGKFEEALEYVWKTTRLVGQTTGVMLLYSKFIEGCLCFTQGRLDEVIALTHSTLSEIESSPARYSGGGIAVAVLHAEALYEKNKLVEAENLLVMYRTMLPTVVPDIMIIGLRTLARIRLAHGDTNDATRYLAQLERHGAERGFLRVSATARQERLRIALQRGELRQAQQIYREHDDRSVWLPFEGRCMVGNDPETPEITRLRLLIGVGQAKKSLESLKNEVIKAKTSGYFRQELLLQILTAKALEACGEKRQALRVLKEALISAQGEGFIRSFTDEGDPIPNMILEIRKSIGNTGITGEEIISVKYLDQLLGAMGMISPSSPDNVRKSDSTSQEPLTAREIDVLGKVAMGFSNEDLADQLCLSVHTIRFHLRNIYSKLGAHNRTQAVALARHLGFIS